jgi:hypothetical protein
MDHMDDHEDKQIPTIFHDILLSKLPPAEKKLDRIYQEGQTLVAAGTETTAWTLSVIMFYLLNDPAKLQRLTNELRKANATTSTELEQLPYLNGVVQEGLRLGLGVSHRLPRIAPDETLTLVDGEKTWLIPPGVGRLLAFNSSAVLTSFVTDPSLHVRRSSASKPQNLPLSTRISARTLDQQSLFTSLPCLVL